METSNDLQVLFINALHDKIPKRYQLVRIIAETLKIEKESASRRLSGKVLFTVREMGILAKRLGISIDNLLLRDQDYSLMPFKLGIPGSAESMDVLVGQIEIYLNHYRKLCMDPAEIGIIFNTIPMEFCVEFPYLCKLMYFKWGHYFIGTEEFNDYQTWNIPERLKKCNREIIEFYSRYNRVTYIWDYSAVWNLVNDILYFSNIHIINKENMDLVKQDLHRMMENMENMTQDSKQKNKNPTEVNIYVSNVNIELYCACHFSTQNYFCYFMNYFMQSSVNTDHQTCIKVKDWINSMRKVSTLITGSGERYRRLFFKEQHQYIDLLSSN